eukprot:5010323-Prymnesium_polylepis.1
MRKHAAEAELERKHVEAQERAKTGEDAGGHFGMGNVKVKGWRRVKLTHSMHSPLFDLRVDAKVAQASKADVSHVLTEVRDENLVSEIPMWMQGNKEFHQMDALRQRFELRRHPLVLKALDPWWQTAQRSMREDGEDCSRLTRNEYIRIFTMVFKVMVEDDFSEDEAL